MTLLTNVQSWLSGRGSRAPADPDSQLMWRYRQAGDADLLARLMHSTGDDLYHFLLTQTDATLADDLYQGVWLRVMERRHQYEPGTATFKTWLFTLGRNLMIDELRRQKRWSATDLEAGENDLATTAQFHTQPLESTVALDNLHQHFDQALMALPFVQREAFVLQQEGFSLNDISDITGIGQETIKSRLRFARQTLQQQLESHHGPA
ncbi:sigma-70 family RNA polymerase sigma factor [Saccharospirillum impatiens]|uniref:sigma-70 family RNA polymerase sigma factor n=1 Tax=Saccharospirillum impatiens TaxID=169438 RepID=UPI0004099CFA|nr:sigma-70 family RNA polymerase sigma factor [Saccharospirillum impatiens]